MRDKTNVIISLTESRHPSMALVVAIALAAVSMVVAACDNAPAATPAATSADTRDAGTIVPGADVQTHSPSAPCHDDKVLAIVVLIDLSRSMRTGTTPRPVAADFDPVLEYVGKCGGEFAIGMIGSFPRPLIRFFSAHPPRGEPALATTSTASDTLHQIVEVVREEEASLARLASEKRREAETAAAITSFKVTMLPFFEKWETEDITDVGSMLQVVDAFFQEPRSLGSAKLEPVLLLYSDGRDDAHVAPIAPLSSQPFVAMVNALDEGDLHSLGIVRFTDTQAAIRSIMGRI